MKSFVSPVGYYEGDKQSPNDIEVPQRPDHFHDWDGATWQLNIARKAAADAIIAADLADSEDLATVKADNQLINFVQMTPVEINTWITTNVTDLPSARNALKILAKIVLVVARKSLR
jgi:hypothetical protein